MRVRLVRDRRMIGCWGSVTKNGVSSLFALMQSKWMRVMRGRGGSLRMKRGADDSSLAYIIRLNLAGAYSGAC
jgi:hypothetical protein